MSTIDLGVLRWALGSRRVLEYPIFDAYDRRWVKGCVLLLSIWQLHRYHSRLKNGSYTRVITLS